MTVEQSTKNAGQRPESKGVNPNCHVSCVLILVDRSTQILLIVLLNANTQQLNGDSAALPLPGLGLGFRLGLSPSC